MELYVEINWINISGLPKDLELITITKTESLFAFDTEYDILHETVTMGANGYHIYPYREFFSQIK